MTAPIPGLRRAVAFETFGPLDSVRTLSLPNPHPQDQEVLVRVGAATINPTDLLMVQGAHAASMRDLTPPYIAGLELAGAVVAIGPNVRGLTVGQAVMGIVNPRRPQGGAHADYVCLPAASVAPLPAGVDLVRAATVPMNGLTARMCLELINLPAGASLLVTGAAGAVGGFVIGLARHASLRVIADARDEDRPLLTSLGAQDLVPRGAAFDRAVRALCPSGVDAVIDAALLGNAAADLVRPGGSMVSLRRSQQIQRTDMRHAHVSVLDQATRTEALVALVDQMVTGVLVPRVAHTFEMADAARAFRRMAQGGLRGRVVLAPDRPV